MLRIFLGETDKAATRSSASVSQQIKLNEYLELMNQFSPGWDEWDDRRTNKKVFCIPEMLDLTKQFVGPPKS